MPTAAYIPTHQLRIVTAASLFDGHDAAINIMRRIMQASGAESHTLGTQPFGTRNCQLRHSRKMPKP